MKQKLLEMVQVTALFNTFPPLMYIILFGLAKTETSTKTAPWVQNWVTKAAGRHNLVLGRDLALQDRHGLAYGYSLNFRLF